MLMRALMAMLMLGLCSLGVRATNSSGTALPVMLNSTLDARRAKPGQPISGRIMQDVPLPDGWKIS